MTDDGTGCFRSRRIRQAVILVSWVIGAASGSAATLEPAELESNEGYYQLRWDAEEPVRLVESSSPDFVESSVVYSGSDSGHVASGKPDGVWYYRLETADGSSILSETATITVRHHSLARALSFFVLGAVVFAATLGLILGAKPDRDERA